jgi:hypothetical protein
MRATTQLTRASRPFSLNQTGTLLRRHLAQFVAAVDKPMLAMSLLLAVFEPATTAASMAIDGPGTIDDAPARGPERSGG